MYKNVITLFLLFAGSFGFGQSITHFSIGAVGLTYVNLKKQLSTNLGEVSIPSYTHANQQLTLGLLQVWQKRVSTSTIFHEEDETELSVFPSPFFSHLNVKSQRKINLIQIFGIEGDLITSIVKPGTHLDLSDMKSGAYIIKAYDRQNKFIASTKTIKL